MPSILLRTVLINLAILLSVSSSYALNINGVGHRRLYLVGQYKYIGNLPPELKEFSSIDIYSVNSKSGQVKGKVTLTGKFIDHKFLAARLSGDRFSLMTESIAGISYKFEGRLLRKRAPKEEGGHEIPQLEGTLMKLHNGEKLAKVTGIFDYEEFAD